MYQNYGYQQPAQMRPVGLKGRPVSSLEEARAAAIDFDGSIFYFPDYANKRIYTKQINLDGTSSFMMYELKEIPMESPVETRDFITRAEFEQAIQQLTQSLSKPIETPAPATRVNF